MITIDARHQNLIGDALCAVPYMAWLCEKHKSRAIVHNGFNPAVRELLTGYPFDFYESLTAADCPHNSVEASYDLNLPDAWQLDLRHNWRWHMSQIYFAFYGAPIPPVPMRYPMTVATCRLPSGLVLTPFSRTNAPDNNKLWPHDRWVRVLRGLLDAGYAERAYVLGTSVDDMRPYQGHDDIEPVLNKPLPEVLDLCRRSPLVLGLDNGISHLCHVGGVLRHVMIYADCLPPRLAENPAGVHVRGAFPIDISIGQVFDAAESMLRQRVLA